MNNKMRPEQPPITQVRIEPRRRRIRDGPLATRRPITYQLSEYRNLIGPYGRHVISLRQGGGRLLVETARLRITCASLTWSGII
jgi:hypothetical protein